MFQTTVIQIWEGYKQLKLGLYDGKHYTTFNFLLVKQILGHHLINNYRVNTYADNIKRINNLSMCPLEWLNSFGTNLEYVVAFFLKFCTHEKRLGQWFCPTYSHFVPLLRPPPNFQCFEWFSDSLALWICLLLAFVPSDPNKIQTVSVNKNMTLQMKVCVFGWNIVLKSGEHSFCHHFIY